MTNYINLNFDLYIHVNDLSKLEKGETVIGYREVNNPSEYEYAFLPALQVNENEYEVNAIIE